MGSTPHATTSQVAPGSPSRCGVLIFDQVKQWVPVCLSTKLLCCIKFTPVCIKSSGWWPKQGPPPLGWYPPWLTRGRPPTHWSRSSLLWARGSHNFPLSICTIDASLCFHQFASLFDGCSRIFTPHYLYHSNSHSYTIPWPKTDFKSTPWLQTIPVYLTIQDNWIILHYQSSWLNHLGI